MAAETTELAKNVIAFLLTGIGSTVLFLMPGYLLGTTMDRGRQGPAVSERRSSPTWPSDPLWFTS